MITECTKKLDKMFREEDIIDSRHRRSRGHNKHCWPSAEGPRIQQNMNKMTAVYSCIVNPVVMNFAPCIEVTQSCDDVILDGSSPQK